jgi:hypothetical protein
MYSGQGYCQVGYAGSGYLQVGLRFADNLDDIFYPAHLFDYLHGVIILKEKRNIAQPEAL